MTGAERLTGATPCLGIHWKAINWHKVNAEVKRLQTRIAKAEREKDRGRVRVLQWILTHSFSAKLLAVKRVTTNRGARTPGVDRVVWNTPAKKMRGALLLRRKGYRALPLRRILIPKKNGKKRPLGIPAMRDRAMQALYALALEPLAETLADPNSYGFRPYRACRDAIGQCFCVLGKSSSPKWILEADIRSCFDWIDHLWLLANVPMDNGILRQWLKSGYVQNRKLFPTRAGTPQGGVASPLLANMTLDGLEEAVRRSYPKLHKGNRNRRTKVHIIRYADDFIVTADTREILVRNVIPAIEAFLEPRGLELSKDKTRIVNIEQGFDFLGQKLRKYRDKLIITPSKDSVRTFLDKVRRIIRASRGRATEYLISRLNPVIRGWANYHCYVQSSKAFSKTGAVIFNALSKWACKRHGNKSRDWIHKKYFCLSKRPWRFACKCKTGSGTTRVLELVLPYDTPLLRYYKIKADSNPYDPGYSEYYRMRRSARNTRPIRANIFSAGLPWQEGFSGARAV